MHPGPSEPIELVPGARFPNLNLPDHTGRMRHLSELARGDPLALFTARGPWCPKEQRYLRELTRVQDEFEVAYAGLAVVTVDPPEIQAAFRAGLGARFTFLSDSARSWLTRLGLQEPPLRRREPLWGGPRTGKAAESRCSLPRREAGGWSLRARLRPARPDAAVRYDEPEVQQVRRDALAWWVPLLGDSFVCLSTFALDASRFAGAVTVARDPRAFGDDPFARLFEGTVVETGSEVPPPGGPVIERWAGAPWPGGRFGQIW